MNRDVLGFVRNLIMVVLLTMVLVLFPEKIVNAKTDPTLTITNYFGSGPTVYYMEGTQPTVIFKADVAGTLTVTLSRYTYADLCGRTSEVHDLGRNQTVNIYVRGLEVTSNPGTNIILDFVPNDTDNYNSVTRRIPIVAVEDNGHSSSCTHTGGTHENGGKCTLCGEVYQNHTMKTEWSKDETSHWYECTFSGCTFKGSIGNHEGGTHENGGTCSICGEVYQNHTMSTEWSSDDIYHWHQCTFEGCDYGDEGILHEGGTHENGGTCTVCGKVYQNHVMDTEWSKDATSHWHECTFEGCNYKENVGNHEGGTHANNGVCTTCGQWYQIHGKGEIIEYVTTGTTHTPIFRCVFEDCDELITGESENHVMSANAFVDDDFHERNCLICNYRVIENHTGGSHNNMGMCLNCNISYQNHGESPDVKEYITSSVGHTSVYKCKSPNCSTTYLGTLFEHVDEDNDLICDICEYELPNPDIFPPVATLALKNPKYTLGNAEGTSTRNVTMKITATDDNNITQMALANENSRNTVNWVTYAEEVPWTLSEGDGVKTVYLMLKDEFGNVSVSFTNP